ncbi:MAG: HK97 family phage prohead protease [Fimbriimonadaceae bacterium]|nr:HK97 family phage prohead protease [Alphaproteobacteria bacterium]
MHDSNSALKREVKFAPLDLQNVDADGTFEGYASLFNKADLGGDMVLPGAFRDSLASRGHGGIKMLFQHDPGEPVGIWSDIREDALGLYVKGRLLPDVARAREILTLMRAGALEGLSIGFRTVRSRTDPRTKLRKIEKLDLWEISIVTFPMLPDARISAVKHQSGGAVLPTPRQFERWLTRDAGLTRSQARAVMRHGIKGLAAKQDAAGGRNHLDRLLARTIRRAATTISNMR